MIGDEEGGGGELGDWKVADGEGEGDVFEGGGGRGQSVRGAGDDDAGGEYGDDGVGDGGLGVWWDGLARYYYEAV